ncbi:PepSY domain-containing protein [Streptomyces sp. NBC_00063]|uniref:PepSY domain-containing protein n=1 Tax=Streptomyces sp. NBC_00063 TaxID=2975638 RepID=UPI002B1D8AB1|nr:PepSY domain-containing protein [Streptomyces sp. NBC_00063]
MKRNIVIATIAAVALIGGGTATAVAVAGGDDDTTSAGTSTASRGTGHDDDRAEHVTELRTAKVTASDAIASALKSVPGTAVSAELDDENDHVVWEVEVLNGTTWHDVLVDPATGEVTGSHTSRHDDTARVTAVLKGARTTAQDAARAAAAKGTVTEIDLDDDGTAHAWEAETTAANGTDADWRVDLRTGAVTPNRSSHDAGDDHRRDDTTTRATHDAGDDHGRDDTATGTTHDAGDDHGRDDTTTRATHDAGDDHGRDDTTTHDAGDDHGGRGHDGDDDHGHHGDDD